jgi:hypothetical protein
MSSISYMTLNLQLRITFFNVIVPLYYDQVDVLLMMTTSLSSIYLLLQYINKIRQKELNPGIKDFDEKIQIIANLTFSLVIALFQPDKLNAQQRFAVCATQLTAALTPPQNLHHGDACKHHKADGIRKGSAAVANVVLCSCSVEWCCNRAQRACAEHSVSALPGAQGSQRKSLFEV